MEGAGFVSRRPDANDFNQQKLTNWGPKCSTYDFIVVYYVFTLLCLVLGAVVYTNANGVCSQQYLFKNCEVKRYMVYNVVD